MPMNSFTILCVFTVVLGLLALAGISPLLWDAAGAVNEALNHTYRLDISIVGD